ncbi:hypothetical protein ESP57_00725 [Agromyces fucosus]|uniref:Uncharacterized protein n=1 Tax=Agromyces fucosus TaxID=41985 RepID=A0A4Q2JQ50_9MICO|nr:hypothetical protein [Agromyces fucosus]RXZ50381.1 hypothetical protein ESP57_00725 [Agromyces fucosus]
MTELEADRDTDTNRDTAIQHKRSTGGLVSIISLSVLALVPTMYVALLLSLSIHGYQTYTGATMEPGDNAAMNASEEYLGIVIASVAFVILWLLVTGIAAAIAASTGWPVVRTVLFVGGALVLAGGVLVVAGLTIGAS